MTGYFPGTGYRDLVVEEISRDNGVVFWLLIAIQCSDNMCSPEFGMLARIAPLTLEFMQKAPLEPKNGYFGCCAAMLESPRKSGLYLIS